MHNLKPLTPLGHAAPRSDVIGAITITENTETALASVAARDGQSAQVQEALTQHFGLSLPAVGQSSTSDPIAAFWMGPDQWMLTAPHSSHELLASELKAKLGSTASVAEQTDGWCQFVVTGEALGDLFERLTNAPVRTMANGEVRRTTLEHLGVFLWCRTDGEIAILGPRSSAGSLHHAVMAAAKSIA